MGTRPLPLATMLVMLSLGAAALGQHRISREPYTLETFGMFRSVILNGDFTPKVMLRDVMAKHPTTG